jgi:hypothetical protein
LSISNNCIIPPQVEGGEAGVWHGLSSYQKRAAEAVAFEIQRLVETYGIERVLFITFTFAQKIYDPKEANRRWHSLACNVLLKRYLRIVACVERHESGVLHFHAVVITHPGDYRTGFDWGHYFKAKEEYRKNGKSERFWFHTRGYGQSARPELRAEWLFWLRTMRGNRKWKKRAGGGIGSRRGYDFGRVEATPVRSTAEGVARYLGGYIGKNVKCRPASDKGLRMTRFLGFTKVVKSTKKVLGPHGKVEVEVDERISTRRGSIRFGWNKPRAQLWRAKVTEFLASQGFTGPQMERMLGANWLYQIAGRVWDERLPVDHALAEFAATMNFEAEIQRRELLSESGKTAVARPSYKESSANHDDNKGDDERKTQLSRGREGFGSEPEWRSQNRGEGSAKAAGRSFEGARKPRHGVGWGEYRDAFETHGLIPLRRGYVFAPDP